MEQEQEQAPTMLARYKSHKIVEAAKIDHIHWGPSAHVDGLIPWADLHFSSGCVRVNHAFLAKHNPQSGGYFVRYPDGYESFSPAAAFDEGYNPVDRPDVDDAQAEPETPCRSFAEQLAQLINHHSLENGSNTPDFILAEYLRASLIAFDVAVSARARWHGDTTPMPGDVVNAEFAGLVPIDARLAQNIPVAVSQKLPSRFQIGDTVSRPGFVGEFTVQGVQVTESKVHYILDEDELVDSCFVEPA